MRIRFLKNIDCNGNKTVIVDGVITIENCRFFVEVGQVIEVQDYIVANDGKLDIIFKDNCIFRVGSQDIELSEPSGYSPTPKPCGCNK
jgi:hypothetical protein